MKTFSYNNEMTIKNQEYWRIRSSFHSLKGNLSGERLVFVFPVLSNLYESTGCLQHSKPDRYLQNEGGVPPRLKLQLASPRVEKGFLLKQSLYYMLQLITNHPKG